jgi:hypothetical protein
MFGNLSIIINFPIVDGYMASTRAEKWLVGSRIQIDDTQDRTNSSNRSAVNARLATRPAMPHIYLQSSAK